MSLIIAAEHLKSKGRGPDTELVHMTKGEIKGLRQLAMAQGGDLTINPETGLYEAGFLSKILPVVAAAAATYFTAGAAAPALSAALGSTAAGGILAGAGAGALIGGISSGIQGGNVGKGALFGGLGGALSGGLGAYDAAPNVFSSLGDASNVAVETGAQAGNAAAATGSGFTPTDPFLGSVPPTQVPMELTSSMVPQNIPTSPGISLAEGQKLAGPTSYYSGLGSDMTDMAKKAAILAAPGIGAQMGEAPPNEGLPTGESESTLNRISPNFRAQEPTQPNPYYTANYPDYRKNPYIGMAGGGAVAFANRGIVQDLPRSSGADVGTYSDADPNTRNLDAYNAALYRFSKANKKAGIKAPVQFKQAQALGDVEEAAAGGIMRGIGGYSDGGRMLKGPGDGMSDSIPAVIGSKQPARLADGEFVVPADVVSHLGNGSTDAGAKRLYGMMDKIRKARTGKKKQAPEVKAHKFLPA
jgi:hypothetical protein